MSRLKLVALSAFAWFAYGIGLISPLTPSEGVPSLLELAIFALGPVGLLILLARRVRSVTWKIMMIVQAAVIIAFTTWLLALQAGVGSWSAMEGF